MFSHNVKFSSVQSLSHVWLFAIPQTAACQASLSLTISWSLPKFMFTASVMSSHFILWHPLLLLPSIFHSIRDFPKSCLFTSDDQNTGASALASVLPMSIQSWLPIRLTGLILLSKGLSGVSSSTTVWTHQFFGAQPSLHAKMEAQIMYSAEHVSQTFLSAAYGADRPFGYPW